MFLNDGQFTSATRAEARIEQVEQRLEGLKGRFHSCSFCLDAKKKRLPRISKTDASKQNEKPTLNKSFI